MGEEDWGGGQTRYLNNPKKGGSSDFRPQKLGEYDEGEGRFDRRGDEVQIEDPAAQQERRKEWL